MRRFCLALLFVLHAGLVLAQGVPPRPEEAAKQEPVKEPAKVPAKKGERPKDQKALFATFASMPGLEVRYTEKKHLALLAVPLESKGRLYFLPPGYLARVVEAPEKSTLLITPQQLRMVGRDGAEVIDLRQSDRLRLFVTSLVRVFSGDAETLERLYKVDYTPNKSDETTWRLTLIPRDEPLTQMLKQLVLHGDCAAVTRIEVVDSNGDRTVTTVTEADPKREFDKSERTRLFGIEDKKAP